jgi:hypothetical protein
MKTAFSRFLLAPLIAFAVASFGFVPQAEAARAGGGGGGGGGARAGAAGGGQRNVQANNANADARTNNVRNTSVTNVNNNVNVNKNVNVNQSVNVNVQNNGCCNNGWDNDYHPIATAAAVTATVAVTSAVIGSMVHTVPPSCVPVNYAGMVYQQCGGTWYQPQGTQFVVVAPPY